MQDLVGKQNILVLNHFGIVVAGLSYKLVKLVRIELPDVSQEVLVNTLISSSRICTRAFLGAWRILSIDTICSI